MASLLASTAIVLSFVTCAQAQEGDSSAPVIATGLHVPWGIAFLPDGDALVSERTTARILRVPAHGGPAKVVEQVPGVDVNAGEGGLLGIALSPDYGSDGLVYAYLTGATDNRVVRFRLGGRPETVLSGIDRSSMHNGGRIAFGPDGMLYVATGDAEDSANAQDLDSLAGKILRVEPDGSVPADNPYPGSPIWSLGHRDVQGLAWDEAGRLWATEFGEDDSDEVNLIEPGRNYGWPWVEGVGPTWMGLFTNPLVTWRPSDASPSGAAIVGDTLYVAALRGRSLWRVPLEDGRPGRPERLYQNRFGRLRTVVAAPDGSLWIATSNTDGRGDPIAEDDRILSVPADRAPSGGPGPESPESG